jgi:fumarate reductase subunit D
MEQEPVKGTVMPHFDPKDVEDHKVMAALSYLHVLCLVPLLGMKSSRYAQEHAKQGLILLILWIVGAFVFWIPLFGWIACVALAVVNVMALIKCLNGEFWEIPVIGQYRSKVNL